MADLSKTNLPFNIDDLLHHRSVESNRLELKASWDAPIKDKTIRTVCAFANDYLNLNGGYIILGVEEQDGMPILPSRGLSEHILDGLQREIRGLCRRIQPEYQPILYPVIHQGKAILIIQVPAGDNRPYQAPKHVSRSRDTVYNYYIRQGSETIEARGATLTQLMELAAKIPFDDRKNLEAKVEDISPSLVRRFLHDIRSDLLTDEARIEDSELYRKLQIIVKVNAHEVPKNVGLLFFNENPEGFFRGAKIEVVQFGDGTGGDLIEERTFRGPLNQQVKETLRFLDSLGGLLNKKINGQAEVERTVPYPYEAMEEAVVNAVYHRGYDSSVEPVKVYMYPDRMEIISYPGPVPGISREHFEQGNMVPPVPARNRRIGDILKELRLAEGRGTGIPKIVRKMKDNGSPDARFDFDEGRTFFRVTLPVHPRYQVLHALRESAHLWATGDKKSAIEHLERSFKSQPNSGALAKQLIEYSFADEDIDLAKKTLETFESQERKFEEPLPFLSMARLLLDRGDSEGATSALNKVPRYSSIDEKLEAAILKKRARDFKGAHVLFLEAYSLNPDDPKIVHEFAQTKMGLAGWNRRNLTVRRRLNKEAVELLRRAIQLSDSSVREAWCWFDLARSQRWLTAPVSEIEQAYLKAISLLPEERRFRDEYRKWKKTVS